MPSATLNCDMGESFGLYSFGADEAMMGLIHVANVACGFHGSDFNHMRRTVQRAREAEVAIGAHPSLPDLQGFGRRVMEIAREELANCILYQIGALSAFLRAEGVVLAHIKPHGALYSMAARRPEIAHAIADAADVFHVPIFGLPGTCHESVYAERGHAMVPEFFADLDYSEAGELIITREHPPVDPGLAVRRVTDAVLHKRMTTPSGRYIPLSIRTICVHSDTPNVVEIATAIRAALDGFPS